ncbi:MAG: extracellular solute-binding protein [Gemmatimonadetes bacterium]|jgi:ABC-type sugar transport system permease subunit|nr:extracellular solute-binding protein [Gemmatimonadota bacterium]MBT6144870.1 extracellular solute-binding protein [Gemmatimonadota bacterium]MBT7863681.1 extracellular solute-binding protein [Gemmatimonadota bacterium]
MNLTHIVPSRRSGLASLLVAIVLISLAPTHGVAASDAEPVVVISGDLPAVNNVSAGALAQRAVLRAFLRDHPDYVFKPFAMPKIQGHAMDTGPLMGISSGNPPHAIYVNFRQSSSYMNHGFLEPLEVLLARVLSPNEGVRQSTPDGEWLTEPSLAEIEAARDAILSRVPEPVWPVIHRVADTDKTGIPPGRHIWAMPTTVLAKVMLYRKDVFQQAGLDPRHPPGNWQELLDYGRRIKALPGKYGITFAGGPAISWGAYSLFASNGATFMDRGPEGRWRASFNTPEMAEAIYFLLRLVDEPFEADGQTYKGIAYVGLPGNDASLKWERGQVGMQFSSLEDEMLASINPELVGIAPIPDSPRGAGGGDLNARMLGVFRDTSPAQKLAVMEYIWFVASDKAKEIRTRVFVENGYGRFVQPHLLERFGYREILRQVPKGWQETYQRALAHGVPEPYGKNTQFIYDKVSEPINWALQQPLLELPREDALARIAEGLDLYAERVDRYMLGELTEEEWTQRRTVGTSVLLFIVVVFTGSLTWVWRIFSAAEAERGNRHSWWHYRTAYLLILPSMAIVMFWQYAPLMMGAPLALFEYELVIDSAFVGIDNFATILYDGRFWASLGRTFYWVLLTVGLGFWPPIFVAILLDEVPTAGLKYFFRTVFYLPTVVSGVIMVFLWRQLYEPSESGFFNQLLLSLNHLGPVGATLMKLLALGVWLALIGLILSMAWQLRELTRPVRTAIIAFGAGLVIATLMPVWSAWVGPGDLVILARGLDPEQVTGFSGVATFLSGFVGSFSIEPLSWVDDPDLAMLCVVLPSVWATAGPGCIIYLAALKTVPEELIEAATMDGAGILQRLAYITLPRVKFLILIQLVGAIVGSFKGGTNFILAMTGGGPNGATRVLGLDIFERTFMELHYGLGAAMAWVLGAMVIVLTAYQLKRMSQAEFSTADTK